MLFLSIKPKYVDKIRSGEKRVELRRLKPRSEPGDWLAIYESSPTMALVAVAKIIEVKVSTPRCLWRSIGPISGVSKKEFDAYFSGTDQAVGILIENVNEFAHPIPLSDLRSEWPRFNPPQSFRYLSSNEQQFVFDHVVQKRRAAA